MENFKTKKCSLQRTHEVCSLYCISLGPIYLGLETAWHDAGGRHLAENRNFENYRLAPFMRQKMFYNPLWRKYTLIFLATTILIFV